jgi:hypothetical protein
MSLRPAWLTWPVLGHAGLHSETLSQETKQTNNSLPKPFFFFFKEFTPGYHETRSEAGNSLNIY